MKTILQAILFSMIMFGCGAGEQPYDPSFDAPHSVAVDAVILDGVLKTRDKVGYYWDYEIEKQLHFTVGQLNGINGVGDLSKLEVEILNSTVQPDQTVLVNYSAKMIVAWPNDIPLPRSWVFILPESGNRTDLRTFFQAYGNPNCLDPHAHDVTYDIFWYYYRPEREQCQLKTNSPLPMVQRTRVYLEVSDLNTNNKYPEYHKIWEDGQLKVTNIYGQANDGIPTSSDAGIRAFNEAVRKLLRIYGEPVETNIPDLSWYQFAPSMNYVYLKYVFADNRVLDIGLLMVESVPRMKREQIAIYNDRTEDSDLVFYAGHSGLGANIRALARLGRFVANQYQIFVINGCDTFAYVDEALSEAHFAVNPDVVPSKYLDIITNAMPAYFHNNARNNLIMIDGLMEQQKTYREILQDFDKGQRVVVTGEEDNSWPLPF